MLDLLPLFFQALGYFEEAEETSPGWYTGNWLFLGKTYYQLGKKTEAKEYLTKLLEAKPCNPEDTEASGYLFIVGIYGNHVLYLT